MSEAKRILELVGGEENVKSVSHCVTRLRFVLVDESKADIEKLENLKIVKGTFTQAGQFQVVIGNEVHEVYLELIKGTNLKEVSKEEVKEDAKNNQNIFQKISTFLAEIFIPILPAIIVGGLILGFRSILEISYGGTVPIEASQFWLGVHDYLWLIGNAIFGYLPVHVTWSSYKKMGGTPVLGIVLGITLVAPDLLTTASDFVADPEKVKVWDFGFVQFNAIGYQGQVIPAMLVGLFGGWLEVNLNRFVHASVRMIVVPLVVLIITSLLATTIIGPFGWLLGVGIANVVTFLLQGPLGFIGGFIFGFFYAPVVITGLHNTTIAIDLQLVASQGSTPLWPMIALSNIAQGSAVLAMVFVKRSSEDREVSIPSVISAYLGVTEPALFGVNLKYFYPLICGMIGSGFAAAYSRITDVQALSIGIGGLPGILSIRPEDYLNFAIAMLIAIVIPIILTLAVAKRKKDFSN